MSSDVLNIFILPLENTYSDSVLILALGCQEQHGHLFNSFSEKEDLLFRAQLIQSFHLQLTFCPYFGAACAPFVSRRVLLLVLHLTLARSNDSNIHPYAS